MEIPVAEQDGPTFGERHFGNASLGDKRRTKSLVRLTDLMVRHPGGTLPDKLPNPADLKALYRLMDAEGVTHQSVLQPHYEQTRQRMAQHGETIVLIHDTTELDYTMKFSLDGLGPIGKGTHLGYLCHHSLAVCARTRAVLGLTSQILHTRPATGTTRKKTLKQRRQDPKRESRLWIEGFQKSGPAPEGVKVIDVCDRGADTFEVLSLAFEQGRSFVIRSTHDRPLVTDESDAGAQRYLHQEARRLPLLGKRKFNVQENLARTGREAVVGFAAGPVTLAPPKQKRGQYHNRPLDLWVVRVWELDPPPAAQGEKPLEWILLTTEPCLRRGQAKRVIDYYECRPIVEEFHKALKTGCNIEDMQFTRSDRMQPAIALLSVVALSLLQLRDASRQPDAQTRPATEVLHKDYVEVLSLWRHQTVRHDWSVHDFFFALARLGGHQNRKHDHRPGWLILWRGWSKLQTMATGAALARRKPKRCG